MSTTINITIAGGGSLGHVVAGVLAARADVNVTMFTRDPSRWSRVIDVDDCDGGHHVGSLHCITGDPAEAVRDAHLVLLCLPGFAIGDVIAQLAPHLTPSQWLGSVVSSTGFFFQARDVLGSRVPLFGFQRVPFIARTAQYGHSAHLLGHKPHLYIGVDQCPDQGRIAALVELLSRLFSTPVSLLESYYEAALTNSNPLLHPSRLYTMWHDWQPGVEYAAVSLFYEEWTEAAAQLYIDMDKEFQGLLHHIGVRPDAVPDVLTYYESHDAVSLAAKLRSIAAFKGIASPMTKGKNGGFVPDFNSRYFTEDFPWGMRFIVQVAHEQNLSLPIIERVNEWGMDCVRRYSRQ